MQENHVNAKQESSSPKKPLVGGGCDRLKRDEWSEGAVSCLLEAYESKWVLRNRAKLKGQDWEEVARHVSSRHNSTKSPKTQTQCKNKIESMKKRYRSESAASGGVDHLSSWPLYSRLDHLMRGTNGGGGGGGGVSPLSSIAPSSPSVGPTKSTPLVLLESLPAPQPPPPPSAPPPPPCFLTVETAQNSPKSNGGDQIGKEDKVIGEEAKLTDQVSDRNGISMETDSSTPALYGSKDTKSKVGNRMKKTEKRKRRRGFISSNREDSDFSIAQSIQVLAEAVVRSEQGRMETMRELQRMKMEAEAKRGEMDLKRTEIIANTQLEIARIFAACSSSAGKSVDSCQGIAKNCT